MTALEKLKQSLLATGLYSLLPNSFVFAEISALARAIEMYEDEINNLKNEQFWRSCSTERLRSIADGMGLTALPDDALRPVLLRLKACQKKGVLYSDLISMCSNLGYGITVEGDSNGYIYYLIFTNTSQFEAAMQSDALKQLLRIITDDENRFEFVDSST